VVSASKSGANAPICSAMLCPHVIQVKRKFVDQTEAEGNAK
jgi:hypothetical protein